MRPTSLTSSKARILAVLNHFLFKSFLFKLVHFFITNVTKMRTACLGFSGSSVVKNLPVNAGDSGSILGLRRFYICHRETKPMYHNYSACAWEPRNQNYWAHVPQLPEPVLHKRSHHSEKPAHCKEEHPQLAATREKSTQQWRPSTAKNTQINF